MFHHFPMHLSLISISSLLFTTFDYLDVFGATKKWFSGLIFHYQRKVVDFISCWCSLLWENSQVVKANCETAAGVMCILLVYHTLLKVAPLYFILFYFIFFKLWNHKPLPVLTGANAATAWSFSTTVWLSKLRKHADVLMYKEKQEMLKLSVAYYEHHGNICVCHSLKWFSSRQKQTENWASNCV